MRAGPVSAGNLLYRRGSARLDILLAHPGGPFWRTTDKGAWQIPKGRIAPGEQPFETALRGFGEEIGTVPTGEAVSLRESRQASGKRVVAFAIEGQLDPDQIVSSMFELEWPAGSGKLRTFPEVDRARWSSLEEARAEILPSQLVLIDRLADSVKTEAV